MSMEGRAPEMATRNQRPLQEKEENICLCEEHSRQDSPERQGAETDFDDELTVATKIGSLKGCALLEDAVMDTGAFLYGFPVRSTRRQEGSWKKTNRELSMYREGISVSLEREICL